MTKKFIFRGILHSPFLFLINYICSMKYFFIIGSILFNLKINAQAVLTLSNSSHSLIIDNIADFANDIEIYAITNLNVESSLGVNWDLSMIGGSFSSTEYTG